jgi:hypothetical protein
MTRRAIDFVNVFGRYLRKAISTAALVIGLAMTGADAVADNIVQVPDNVTYLGNQMGGNFVVLERHDIRADNGRLLPAFRIQLYRTTSTGAPYGTEREGLLTFDGYGLYVRPQHGPHGAAAGYPRDSGAGLGEQQHPLLAHPAVRG